MSGTGGRDSYIVGIAAAVLVGCVGTAQAQTATPMPLPTGTAHVIEWDLASMQLGDSNPGAIVVDTRGEDHNRVWFVTRFGDPLLETSPDVITPQHVYRLDPSLSLYKAAAKWSGWELHPDVIGGGISRIRPSHDRRFVFARTTSFIQRIDTQNCPGTYPSCERIRYSYPDQEPIAQDAAQNSDIALDDSNRVFTTGLGGTAPFVSGYLQMLNPNAAPVDPGLLDSGVAAIANGRPVIMATRWEALGAGQCQGSGLSFVCNSGIDIHPGKQYLVYYAEPGTNSIVEVNVNITKQTSTTPYNERRWSLTSLGVTQPRTLKIDRRGKVWVNTGSGHLVSLDPSTSNLTKHPLPDGTSADPWGIAPDDDVIGYTAANTNKVGMLFPKAQPVYVGPVSSFVPPTPFPVIVNKEASMRNDGTAPANAKIVVSDFSRACNGTCVEAQIDKAVFQSNDKAAPSINPLGVTANMSKAQGTFFYTVGFTGSLDALANDKRIGFVRLPNKEQIKFARDDDDTDDGFDRTTDARWHNSEPGDADADGVPDQYDTSTSTDNMTIAAPVIVPVGQSSDYPMTTSATTLALIAAVTPDVATATIAVDVYNSLGALVGTSGPIVGAGVATVPTPGAGTYKIRVRNLGTTAVTPTPTIVVREPLIQQ